MNLIMCLSLILAVASPTPEILETFSETMERRHQG